MQKGGLTLSNYEIEDLMTNFLKINYNLQPMAWITGYHYIYLDCLQQFDYNISQ